MADESDKSRGASGSLVDQIGHNIESIAALQRREWEITSASQRRVESVSRFIGRPVYLIALVGFSFAWVMVSILGPYWGRRWDPPPFALLDGLMTFASLLTTTIVLIAQNRQSRLEQQHRHLDLQVNLLTEQKVTKLIHLIEELRRDLPMVKDRHDPHASALQEHADTAQVLSAIEEVGLTRDGAAVDSASTPRA